jgi:hypothetical protein
MFCSVVAGVFLFFSIIQIPRYAEGQPPMAAYCNPNNLISIRYPYDWNLTESASNPSAILFTEPGVRAGVVVSVHSIGLFSAPPPDQLAGGVLQNEKRTHNNFQLLDSRPIYIGNHVLAYKMTYTYTDSNGNPFKSLVIVTDGPLNATNNYFVIIYNSTPSMFNTYLQTAMNMINTIGVASPLVCS